MKPWMLHIDEDLGDSAEALSLNRILDFGAYINHMRKHDDLRMPPLDAVEDTLGYFDQIDFRSPNAALLGILAADLFYRSIAQIAVMDRYARRHAYTAIKYYFDVLRAHGILTFYIVDNTIADDRFACIVELFELGGIGVTSPSLHGHEWAPLERRLRGHLEKASHIAYIEKDASANHLTAVKAMAIRSGHTAAFRVNGTDSADIEILGMPPGCDRSALVARLSKQI